MYNAFNIFISLKKPNNNVRLINKNYMYKEILKCILYNSRESYYQFKIFQYPMKTNHIINH